MTALVENGRVVSYPGPDDPELRRQWRSERRAVARSHHPDRGGDSGDYVIRLAAVDAHFRTLEGDQDARYRDALRSGSAGRVAMAASWVRRGRRRVVPRVRRIRAKLPRNWPGAKRYFDL